jgi:hypothetical protein
MLGVGFWVMEKTLFRESVRKILKTAKGFTQQTLRQSAEYSSIKLPPPR